MSTTPPPNGPSELLLTFAELEALCGNDPHWPSVRAAMNTRPPADDQITVAGLASLILRGLARLSPDGQPEIAGSVASLAHRVGQATTIVGVTLAQLDDTVSPFLLCAGGTSDERVLVRVAGPGIIALSELVNDVSVPTQTAILVQALLDANDGAVLVKPQEHQGITVRKRDDRWETATPVQEGTADFHTVTQTDAFEAVVTCMTSALNS